MTRLLLLFLLLLLSACGMPTTLGGAKTPQNSPQATQEAQNAPQATVRAVEPTKGPDVAATLQTGALWATQTERAYERAVAAQTATQQVIVNGFAYASQTAHRPATTATKAAEETSVSLQVARITQGAYIIRATDEAPALLLEAANAKAQAGSAEFRAWALPWMQFGVGVVCLVVAVLLVAYVFMSWRRQAQAEPVEDEQPERPRIVLVDGTKWTWPSEPPGDYGTFLEWARIGLSGASLSYRNMVGAGKPFRNFEEYTPLWEWAKKWKVTTIVDGVLVLSDDGKLYCRESLANAPQASPTPGESNAQTAPPAANER